MSSPDRHFAFIPRTTTHSAKINSLPFSSRWIYTVMVAERAGFDGEFTMPYREIMKVVKCSKATVRQAVKELTKAGFLYYEHGGLECNPNRYTLEPSWLKL